MQLLIVRHGKAGTREEFASTGLPDSDRPLTKKGRRKFKDAMPGLRTRVPSIDLLASSPFARALQTAQIISQAYDGIPVIQRRELIPGSSPNVVLPWLSEQTLTRVVIVGHEPTLTELLDVLLSDTSEKVATLKKGAICLLEFQARAAPQNRQAAVAANLEATGATAMSEVSLSRWRNSPDDHTILHRWPKKLPKVLALLDEDMCTGCEACLVVCPVDCISTIPGHRHEQAFQVCTIDLPRCIGCTLCHQVCPWDCITMIPTDQFLQNANTKPQLD